MAKKSYTEESERLAKAIDIAVEAFEKHPPATWDKKTSEHTIKCYKGWKEDVLNPKPQYRSLASLKYAIQDVFIYFNECPGPSVEYFWQQVEKQGLGYERVNLLEKIFVRGKIRGRIEYEFAVDSIAAYEQQGIISRQQSYDLSKMIGDYETKRK